MTVQARSEVLALLERHALRPRKALGQHFLADPNITRKIVAVAGVRPGDRVLEIGAGTGTLTAALLAAGARVLAYEVDEHLRPLLDEVVGGNPALELRFADAASVDFSSELGPGPWQLVANLPYNVGTPILLDLLRRVPAVTRATVMVQGEVADRLAAQPGSAAYGLPSVVAQLHARVRVAFRVPPQVFVPAPRVGSAVVTLERVAAPASAEAAIALAAAAFGQRRKMLRRSLAGRLADPDAALEAAGIAPTERAERLSPEDFVRLAEVAGG